MHPSIQELKDRWILWEVEEHKDGFFSVKKRYGTQWLKFTDEVDERIKQLDKEHQNVVQVTKIMNIYSNLYISDTGHIWVKYNNRDRESINYVIKDIYNPDYDVLDSINKKLANRQEGDFWCNTCNDVRSREQYAFNYFAGYYCKDCLKSDKKVQRIKEQEERETYD